MDSLFAYLRNITFFLVFVAAIGMLAPAGKYKKFVSLVMGFALISIMLAPLARDGYGGVFSLDNILPQFGTHNIVETTANWEDTYLLNAFKDQLAIQLTAVLAQEGFTVYDTAFTFPPGELGQIESVHATVSRNQQQTRVPFIRIQPVQIGAADQAQLCPVAVDARNLISQFYNLPHGHIYVTVR